MVHVGLVPFRLLRAGVFSAACVAVSALLHVAAGGHLHGVLELAAAAVGLAGSAFLIARRQRGLPVILASCAVAQVVLHVLFNLHSLAPFALHPGHAIPTPGMVLAHLLALAASAVWLRRGEAALAIFLDLLRAAFATPLRLLVLADPMPPRRPAPRPPWRELPDLHSVVLATARRLRGPPEQAEASL